MYTEVLIPGIIFGSFVAIIKIILDYRTKRLLIEKGEIDERARGFFAHDIEAQRLSSLKWGLVLVGLGLALMLSYLNPELFDDGGTFGLMLLFAGIGFLVYFGLAQKMLRSSEQHSQNPPA